MIDQILSIEIKRFLRFDLKGFQGNVKKIFSIN